MRRNLQDKVKAVLITIILCTTSVIVIQSHTSNVAAFESDTGNFILSTDIIHRVTENLSNVIYTAYNDTELRKGREFGSKGEHFAKDLIYENMTNLGLSTTIEKIEQYPNDDIDDKLEVLAKGIKINGINPVGCYISPRWNNSYVKKILGQFDSEFKNHLTYNFSYSGLEILRRPAVPNFIQFMSDIIDYLRYEWENSMINDSQSFINRVLQKFEESNEFSFENLTQEEASSLFPWFDDL